MVKRTQLTRLVFERNQGRAIIGAKTSRNAPQKLRGPVITCDGVVQFEAPTASEPAIHLAGALWRSSVGGALLRAAVHAQGAGDTADRPVHDNQGLNGLLLGQFGDVGHAPQPSTRAVPSQERFFLRKWCILSDRGHLANPAQTTKSLHRLTPQGWARTGKQPRLPRPPEKHHSSQARFNRAAFDGYAAVSQKFNFPIYLRRKSVAVQSFPGILGMAVARLFLFNVSKAGVFHVVSRIHDRKYRLDDEATTFINTQALRAPAGRSIHDCTGGGSKRGSACILPYVCHPSPLSTVSYGQRQRPPFPLQLRSVDAQGLLLWYALP